MIKLESGAFTRVIDGVTVDGNPLGTVKVQNEVIYMRTNMYKLQYRISKSGVYGRHFGAGYVNLNILFSNNDTDTNSADWYLLNSYTSTGLQANYHYRREWDSSKNKAKWSREIYSYDKYGNIIPLGTYEWYDSKRYAEYAITVYTLTSSPIASPNETYGEEFCIGTSFSDDRGTEYRMPEKYPMYISSVCGAIKIQKDENSIIDTILSLGANVEPSDADKILVSDDKQYSVSPFTSGNGRFDYYTFRT